VGEGITKSSRKSEQGVVGRMTFEEIEKIIAMAKEKKIQKLKVDGLELEFSSEAYLEDIRNAIGVGPVTEAIKEEDMLFYSAS
jgi:hypothetical protein